MIHMIRATGRRGRSPRFTISTATAAAVLNEVLNSICGSNIQWRGRSLSASVPSDTPKAQKVRKRVSKDQRQAMVESFVNKYREENSGKFPCSSKAHKQVGGSYYVVRKILQELQHKSSILSSIGGTESLSRKELTKKAESMTEIENISCVGVTVASQTQYDPQEKLPSDVEEAGTSNRLLKVEGRMQTSDKTLPEEVVMAICPEGHSDLGVTQDILLEGDDKDGCHEDVQVKGAQGDHPDFVITEIEFQCLEKPGDCKEKNAQGGCSHSVATESHLQKSETKNVSLEEDAQKKHSASEKFMDDHNEGSPEIETYSKDIYGRQTNDAELPKRSTLWQNLRLFKDGIMNIWRKW